MKNFACLAVLCVLFGASVQAATFTVSSSADSGANTLRDAITQANTAAGADTIVFSLATPATITLTSALPNLGADLTITGPGARLLRIEGAGPTGGFRCFFVAGSPVIITDLEIRNFGSTTAGFTGGGIIIGSLGSLQLRRCHMRICGATSGGAIHNNGGTLTLDGCSISSCGAVGTPGTGGGLRADGLNTLTNTTFTGLSAVSGACIASASGTVNMNSCTVTAGNASASGGGLFNSGGAVFTLINCIVGGNTAPAGPDGSGTFGSTGWNLFENTSGLTRTGAQTSDITGVGPVLNSFGNNGGPVDTHSLHHTSPCLDAGYAIGLATDARGLTRIFNLTTEPDVFDGSDTGAAEFTPRFTVPAGPVAFGNIAVGATSAEQTVAISGRDMLSSATVTPPAGYEISQTSGSGFSTAPQNILAGVDNTLAGTIYVRFAPTVGGAANGNLVTTGTQAPTANTALTGNGVTPTITITGALTAFTIAALGTPSAEQTYTVSGIVMTTFISVTAPTGFEVSLTTGAGFGANVNTAAPVSGVIAATTIYVRYNPSAGSSHSGNISHVSTPAPTQNLAASGTVTGSGGGGGGGGGGDDGGCATSEHNAPWLALLAAFAVLAISLRRRLA